MLSGTQVVLLPLYVGLVHPGKSAPGVNMLLLIISARLIAAWTVCGVVGGGVVGGGVVGGVVGVGFDVGVGVGVAGGFVTMKLTFTVLAT